MDTRLTVRISAPKKDNLSDSQREFIARPTDRIEGAGLRVLPEVAGSDGVESRLSRIRQGHGVVVLAFSQWQSTRLYRAQKKSIVMPSEFSHIEAVMSVAAKRPLLVIRKRQLPRVVWCARGICPM
jgi:hypothetical protein